MTTLLITGATGFLGGAVVEKILQRTETMNLLLLVRAGDSEAGLERILSNMRKFNLNEDQLSRLTTSHILCGDLGEPERFLADPRLDSVTHVINCAAVASFGNNPLIWKVNVEGTLAFARRMNNVAGLQRFLHVGTAMSCTPAPNSLVPESAEFRENAEHLVTYTHSKSTIEQLMRQHCPQLPLIIARPSIVVGHTHHGCLPSTSIFWVFSMGLMLAEIYVFAGRSCGCDPGGLLRAGVTPAAGKRDCAWRSRTYFRRRREQRAALRTLISPWRRHRKKRLLPIITRR